MIKIFANNIEEPAQVQLDSIIKSNLYENIRIMPDVHAGAYVPVGFTAKVKDKINPDHIGTDIGCSVSVWMADTDISAVKLERLERNIRKSVMFGQDLQEQTLVDPKSFFKFMKKHMGSIEPNESISATGIDELCERLNINPKMFWKSLGTVGSGNHFIEIGEHAGKLVFTIHCGSRNLGSRIHRYWKSKSDILSGDDMNSYLADMWFACGYAEYNHQTIAEQIVTCIKGQKLKCKIAEKIFTRHNFIDPDSLVIRKGAIEAIEGKKIALPFNMRDGLAICIGLGNPEWNFSGPHGAGRLMSRNQALKNLNMEDFKLDMKGIISTSVIPSVLDESPRAYKNTDEIIKLIEPTMKIEYFIKPLINLKDKGKI